MNLLQEIMNSDIISDEVLKALGTMKIDKVKEIHNYVITPPKNASSRWQTYVKDDMNCRVKVTSISESGLFEKLYQHYFGTKKCTLRGLFPLWIEKRKNDNVSDRTIRRNENHWNKYYCNHDIVNISLSRLNSDILESFFHEVIRKYDITLKELNNMKFIACDMLKMAKRKGHISLNPFDDVIINTYACRPIGKTKDTSRVYLPIEKQFLFNTMNENVRLNPNNTDIYAIFLLFRLGLRIGEVVALTWNDISLLEREIHIHSMETLKADKNNDLRVVVVNYTKKKSPYGDRFLPISDYEINLLNIVKSINEKNGYKEDDYIFCDSDGRTKIREIDNCIRKMCMKANIEIKSAHDIRRTVASEMFNNGISVELIKNYMGHSDIKTTYSYILDNHDKIETAKMINKSLENMCGLIRTQSEQKENA